MRRLLAIAALIMLSSTASYAQSAPGTPAMGATSPLGIPGSGGMIGANSGATIPLGATELDPGGLSQAADTSCTTGSSSMSGVGTPSGASTFDGGGMIGATTSGSCASGSLASSASGSVSLSPPTVGLSTIPLGATEIGNSGVSPMIAVPAPSMAVPDVAAPSIAVPGGTSNTCVPGLTPGC